jgi:hypothetical protein
MSGRFLFRAWRCAGDAEGIGGMENRGGNVSRRGRIDQRCGSSQLEGARQGRAISSHRFRPMAIELFEHRQVTSFALATSI